MNKSMLKRVTEYCRLFECELTEYHVWAEAGEEATEPRKSVAYAGVSKKAIERKDASLILAGLYAEGIIPEEELGGLIISFMVDGNIAVNRRCGRNTQGFMLLEKTPDVFTRA